IPPVGAVNWIDIVCVVPASTGDGVTETVPEPSAALFTVTLGCAARLVRVPPLSDFSFVVQFALPVVVGATPFVYVIVTVWPALRVRLETMIVWLAIETVPKSDVTWPAPAASCGAVQPAGASIVTEPFEITPVATV